MLKGNLKLKRKRRDRNRATLQMQSTRSLLLSGNAEVLQLRRDCPAVSLRLHLLIHVRNLAIFIDVKRPAIGHAALVENAIGLGGFLGGIAQQWEIQLQLVRK